MDNKEGVDDLGKGETDQKTNVPYGQEQTAWPECTKNKLLLAHCGVWLEA